MDFAERQKAVAIAAVFDEGSLQRRFDPRYLGEVDVTFELLAGTCFVVEILKSIARLNHHPGLFRVAGIDKHTFGHKGATPERATRAARGQLFCLPAAARKDRKSTRLNSSH